jgi:hypothetical protein
LKAKYCNDANSEQMLERNNRHLLSLLHSHNITIKKSIKKQKAKKAFQQWTLKKYNNAAQQRASHKNFDLFWNQKFSSENFN